MSKGFDLIKLGVGGVVVAGAVLAGSLVSNSMVTKGGAPIAQSSSSVAPKSSEEPIPEIDMRRFKGHQVWYKCRVPAF